MKKQPERVPFSTNAAGKRLIFTADARLKVQKFAAGTAAAAGPAKIATISGYALVWNTLSSDRGGYKVRLAPGSAQFTTPTRALFHHDFSKPIGTTDNGTLRIKSDDVGVYVEIDLPDTTAGRDVEELVERGDIKGMSFSMVDMPVSNTVTENGENILNATSYMVDEVTCTAIPAFTQTTAQIAEDDEDEDEGFSEKKSGATGERIAQSLKLEQLKLSSLTL